MDLDFLQSQPVTLRIGCGEGLDLKMKGDETRQPAYTYPLFSQNPLKDVHQMLFAAICLRNAEEQNPQKKHR